MTAFDHLDLNLKVMADINLTEQEKNDLVAVSADPGLYCVGCNNCVDSCPMKLPVPDLMRAYMYTYGYANPAMAKSLLAELQVSSDPCRNCDTCSVTCSRNFNIKEKIADVTRLVNIPAEFLA
jgi:ferredoxin